MLGLSVVIALTWIVLWLVSKEHPTALGIIPTRQRLYEFSIGFLFASTLCTIHMLLQGYFNGIAYELNPNYSFLEGLKSTFWTLRATAFEELVFRGVILYLLIKKIGVFKACFIDAIAFGIYHWFSYEMFDRGVIPMIYVFLVTGAGGWMFAYAFAKTKSILAPLGLHFGWIVVSIVVFSEGPLENQLFVANGEGVPINDWITLWVFLFQFLLVPGLVTWYLVKRYPKPAKVTD